MQYEEVFKKNYLVSGLSDEKIAEVAALAENGCKLAGEPLIEKGDKSGDLFVILDGTVNVFTAKWDKISESGPGSVLGEVALVDAGPRSASAVCKGLVHFARLPAKELRAYMAANKDVGFVMLANLSRVLSMRLRQTAEVMEDLRAKTADPWQHAL
ncbi:MAG TPA: cyclic nucleotide-binding domain-containing protein [Fimbriimonadaceae bacterium]|nr:cyclic nucleotide-binding domain-containing protein [Fimbriimonadaceae bacterium]